MSEEIKKLDSSKTKKENKVLERVTIGDDLKDKLASLCSQANEALQGRHSVAASNSWDAALGLRVKMGAITSVWGSVLTFDSASVNSED